MREDRRSRRTRQLITEAFMELLEEKRYESITVQDILDRANIGRSTFYAHYTDKEALLMSHVERIIHDLELHTMEAGAYSPGLLPSLELFRHIQQQRRLIGTFMGIRGTEMHTEVLERQAKQMIEKNLQAVLEPGATLAVPVAVLAGFVASTFLMLLRWWFSENLRSTPEQMDEMFQKLVMPGIDGLIQPQK